VIHFVGVIAQVCRSSLAKSLVKKLLLDTPEGRSPIGKSVQVVLTPVKNTQPKVFPENVGIWTEGLQTSEKENNYNLEQYLNIDHLPESTCFCINVQAWISQSVGIALPDSFSYCSTAVQNTKIS